MLCCLFSVLFDSLCLFKLIFCIKNVTFHCIYHDNRSVVHCHVLVLAIYKKMFLILVEFLYSYVLKLVIIKLKKDKKFFFFFLIFRANSLLHQNIYDRGFFLWLHFLKFVIMIMRKTVKFWDVFILQIPSIMICP